MKRLNRNALASLILATTIWWLPNAGDAAEQTGNRLSSTTCRECNGSAKAEQPLGSPGTRDDDASGPHRGPSPTLASTTGTCCWRTVGTQIEVPANGFRDEKISEFRVVSAWESVFLSEQSGGGPALTDCPLMVDIMDIPGLQALDELADAIGEVSGAPPDPELQQANARLLGLDYLFVGRLSVDEATSRFTFTMDLVDHHHGAVVQPAETTWIAPTDEVAGSVSRSIADHVRALAKTFVPLDDLLHDYERTPERAQLRPDRSRIQAGKEMTIHLRGIRDSQGRPPQPWQHVVVEVEKGKILNGKRQDDGSRAFEVGGGNITLRYRAPEKCKNQTDTVRVYNSCQNDAETFANFLPERKIASTEFDVVCVGGKMDVVIDVTHTVRWEDMTAAVEIRESGSIPFRVDFSVEPPRVEGEGTWQANSPPSWAVHVSGITWTGLSNPVVIEKLHGTLIENGSDPMTLEFWFDRSCDGGQTWTPQGPYEPIPLVDGFTKSYPANSAANGHTPTGGRTVKLHLENHD
jgi:hypothetical protein